MAIISEATVDEEEEERTIAEPRPSTLPDLLAALLPPPELLPPPQDDRSLVSVYGLDAWQAGFERTVGELARLTDDQPETWSNPEDARALAFALSRWLPAEAAEEQEGWVLDVRVRSKVGGTHRRHLDHLQS